MVTTWEIFSLFLCGISQKVLTAEPNINVTCFGTEFIALSQFNWPQVRINFKNINQVLPTLLAEMNGEWSWVAMFSFMINPPTGLTIHSFILFIFQTQLQGI